MKNHRGSTRWEEFVKVNVVLFPYISGLKLAVSFEDIRPYGEDKERGELQLTSIPLLEISYNYFRNNTLISHSLDKRLSFYGYESFIDQNSLNTGQIINFSRSNPSPTLYYAARIRPHYWEEMKTKAKQEGMLPFEIHIQSSIASNWKEHPHSIYTWCPSVLIDLSMMDVTNYIDIWAKERGKIPNFPNSVPVSIIRDMVESSNCLDIGASKASAAMSRRALQAALIDMGVDKRKKLWTQIDEVVSLSKLNKALASMAHGVRYLGNYGVHPSDDLMENIDLDEARLGHQIVEAIIKHLYS